MDDAAPAAAAGLPFRWEDIRVAPGAPGMSRWIKEIPDEVQPACPPAVRCFGPPPARAPAVCLVDAAWADASAPCSEPLPPAKHGRGGPQRLVVGPAVIVVTAVKVASGLGPQDRRAGGSVRPIRSAFTLLSLADRERRRRLVPVRGRGACREPRSRSGRVSPAPIPIRARVARPDGSHAWGSVPTGAVSRLVAEVAGEGVRRGQVQASRRMTASRITSSTTASQ